jgi:alpha-L-rhamnosidase
MIEKGATTVWELWNGDTADPAMNSGNHVMLVGDFIIWLYEDLAGIKPDPAQPGFKHIIMQPHPVGDLKFVKATHESPYGRIISEWSRGQEAFDWNITVPPNTFATVYVPASGAAGVSENGKPIAPAKGVQVIGQTGDRLVLSVASGSYRFHSKW